MFVVRHTKAVTRSWPGGFSAGTETVQLDLALQPSNRNLFVAILCCWAAISRARITERSDYIPE